MQIHTTRREGLGAVYCIRSPLVSLLNESGNLRRACNSPPLTGGQPILFKFVGHMWNLVDDYKFKSAPLPHPHATLTCGSPVANNYRTHLMLYALPSVVSPARFL